MAQRLCGNDFTSKTRVKDNVSFPILLKPEYSRAAAAGAKNPVRQRRKTKRIRSAHGEGNGGACPARGP